MIAIDITTLIILVAMYCTTVCSYKQCIKDADKCKLVYGKPYLFYIRVIYVVVPVLTFITYLVC